MKTKELETVNANATDSGTATAEPPKTYNPNAELGLEKFDYVNFTPELWAEYQAIVQSIPNRKLYDWVQYKAVGRWKQRHNEMTDQMEQTNILIGLEILDQKPINTTRMERQHIEDWAQDRQGRMKMIGGLNAQIYDKSNNRQNSRYYLLKKVEVNNA